VTKWQLYWKNDC